ncbi:MAG: hypothetical protein R6V75_01385 [Bacteroidales bacterium]
MEQTDHHINEAIRRFLSDSSSPFDPHAGLEQVPDSLFELIEPNGALAEINRKISTLSSRKRKLLRFYCEGHQVQLISESIDFETPEQLWIDLAESAGSVAGMASRGGADPLAPEMKQQVLSVFEAHDRLADRIVLVIDQMEEKAEKRRKKRRRYLTIVLFPAILVPAILVFYPMVSRPGLGGLYESFRSAYQPDMHLIDTLELSGRDFVDAVTLFYEGDLAAASELFENVSESVSPHTSGAYWFLALIRLNGQDGQSSREYLELVRMTDPEFFNLYGRKLLKSLK